MIKLANKKSLLLLIFDLIIENNEILYYLTHRPRQSVTFFYYPTKISTYIFSQSLPFLLKKNKFYMFYVFMSKFVSAFSCSPGYPQQQLTYILKEQKNDLLRECKIIICDNRVCKKNTLTNFDINT